MLLTVCIFCFLGLSTGFDSFEEEDTGGFQYSSELEGLGDEGESREATIMSQENDDVRDKTTFQHTDQQMYMKQPCKTHYTMQDCFNTRGATVTLPHLTEDGRVTTLTCSDGWLVFLRRQDGSVNFERSWADYKSGFGDARGEFWLGLDVLHELTSPTSYRLRADLDPWVGRHLFAEYKIFSVGSEENLYRLTVNGYDNSSTAGDALTKKVHWDNVHDGMAFSTFDRDNDELDSASCARMYNGGWWYRHCHSANPTGRYGNANNDASKVTWFSAYNKHYSFKVLELKIRPFGEKLPAE